MLPDSIPPVRSWPPNRKQVVSILTIGFVLLSILTLSWDDLVSHVALGIGIGLTIGASIVAPRNATTLKPSEAAGSIPKTIVFWGFLLLAAVLVYQMVRGPVH